MVSSWIFFLEVDIQRIPKVYFAVWFNLSTVSHLALGLGILVNDRKHWLVRSSDETVNIYQTTGDNHLIGFNFMKN